MARKLSPHKNLIKKIAEDTELYEYQVKSVIISLIQETIRDLCAGKQVHLLSLGKFWVKKLKPQGSWDPYRKTKISLEARGVPKFTFGRRAGEFIKAQVANCLEGSKD